MLKWEEGALRAFFPFEIRHSLFDLRYSSPPVASHPPAPNATQSNKNSLSDPESIHWIAKSPPEKLDLFAMNFPILGI